MPEIRMTLLEVDLTHETSRRVDVTDEVKRYLGGRGLAEAGARPGGAARPAAEILVNTAANHG